MTGSKRIVGAVKYDADLAPLGPNPNANAVASRGDPLVMPGQKLGWGFLPNTEGEANGIVAAAGRKRLTAVRLEGDKATTAAALAAQPKAKYAHFATHVILPAVGRVHARWSEWLGARSLARGGLIDRAAQITCGKQRRSGGGLIDRSG